MKESKWSATHIRAVSLLLLIGALSNDSSAAPGDVDLSFDPPRPGVNGTVSAFAVQPDGKVIIGGWFTRVKGLDRQGIARLNADGSGDSSFNPAAGAYGGMYGDSSIVVQPDGKVLVSHSTWPISGSLTNWGILRLNSDGSMDTNFSVSIQSFYSFPFYEDGGVHAMAVQPDGKVLIGGRFSAVNGTSRKGIARLNADGSLDSSFLPDAVACCANSLALQPDGKVLFIGEFPVNGANRVGIARLNANGSLDNSFDAGGELYAGKMGLQPDGKILVAGNFNFVNRIARLNSDGSLDSSFNSSLPDPPYVGSLVAQSDGKVLITGDFTSVNGTYRIGIARLNADGSLDYSFDPGAGATGTVAGLQPDGKILIGGSFGSVNGRPRQFITRLNANGSLDSSFDPGYDISQLLTVAVQPDGKVLLGDGLNGFTFVNGTNQYGRVRLNADGSLDDTFISNSFYPNTSYLYQPYSVAVQSDGKVIVGGYAYFYFDCDETGCHSVSYQYFVDRFNPDRSHDVGFEATGGGQTLSQTEAVQALAVQPDGKVLVGGNFSSIKGANRRGIARLNANGSLDTSFDAGTVGTNGITSIALQPDGKVLVVSNSSGIFRLNRNGSLDGTFNPASANGVGLGAVQPDGKVLIAGSFTNVNGTNRKYIARLNANGSLDSSFNPGTGPDGLVRSIALQSDGKVLISGDFTTVNGVLRPRVARLYGDAATVPLLSITRSNAFVIVSWPVPGTNFRLEENTSLSLPNGWSAVAATRSTNNSSISVALPATGSRKFFRLSLP